MKVRLVRPLLAEIAQRDAQATAAAPGYDPDFREPRGPRQEKPAITVPAQVETGTHERLQQTFGGNVPDSRLVLVLDCEDLARRGLIDAETGACALGPGDRVVCIRSGAGALLETFPDPPGLYIMELRPEHGLGRDRNLFLAFCQDREQGLMRGV